MKKIIACVLVLTFALSFVLTGCGTPSDVKPSSGSKSETATSKDDGEKTKIVVWTFQRHDMEFVTKVVEDYNATNTDNIEIQFEVMTDNFDNNLDLAFQSNQAPDVFRVKAQTVMPYVQKNMAMPLNDFITDADKARYPYGAGTKHHQKRFAAKWC